MKKVSVVMAYYNRKRLLTNTLRSIEKHTKHDNFEIIIVDDASDEDETLEDVVSKFGMDIKLIRIIPEAKQHINSCVPYNIGFKYATGEVVIIQNPECYHAGDIISHASNMAENKYHVYHCYSLCRDDTENMILNPEYKICPKNRPARFGGDDAYYVHHTYNPRPFHFCSSILKEDLDDLGGFDLRYAHGASHDDDEFVTRIQRKGLDIEYIESPMVFHQWHYNSKSWQLARPTLKLNTNLFHNVTLKETGWRVNQD